MIKLSLFFISGWLLLLFKFVGQDPGIQVRLLAPESVQPGKDFEAVLLVRKGKQDGFAKLQLDLPDGITIKEAEDKGASFSINDNLAKWVWAVLPSEEEIRIGLTLSVSGSLNGDQAFGAKYSYVENNEKRVIEMKTTQVMVSEQANGEKALIAEKQSQPSDTSTQSNHEPAGEVTVSRSVSIGSSLSEYLIIIRINKGNTSGFARYSDDLPEGFEARAGKTQGASFSVSDRKVKFVWVSVPADETIELSYFIVSREREELLLRGEYSYLESNQSKKAEVKPESIAFKIEKPVASTEKKDVKEEVAATGKEEDNTPKQAITPKKTPQKNADIASTAPRSGEPEYRVQIGAFSKRKVNGAQLKNKFNVSDEIISEMHEGFSKFMVGSHKEYKAARDHREEMISGNGVKSAFVVAYNGGRRITVQEALMISNQKWFK